MKLSNENKKSIAGVLITVAFLFTCIIGVLGCEAYKVRKVTDALDTVTDSVALVCSTVELFESSGVETLDPKVCASALKATGSEYYALAYDVADCAEQYKPESVEFLQCIDDVDGWRVAAQKIAEKF